MSQQRLLRGDPRVIDLPKLSADAIRAGDVLWWSQSDAAVRPASAATGADHAAKAGVIGANFAGIATLAPIAREYGSSSSSALATRKACAASLLSSAKIDTQSSERQAGTTPRVLKAPRVGFNPTRLLNAAGTRPR